MRFEHDGVGIQWEVAHAGDLTPVVLVHGLGSCKENFTDLVDALADSGRAVYRLDLRGHGESDRAPGTYRVPVYAADIGAFLEQEVQRPVVLVGHSLGAVISHHITASRPDLVAGALLEDPPLYLGAPGAFETTIFATLFPLLRQQAIVIQASGRSFDDVRAQMAEAPTPWGKAVDTTHPAGIDARTYGVLRGDEQAWAGAIDGSTLTGYDPDAKIVRPLIILAADPAMGPALFPADVDRQRAANPGADIRTVPGAPHGILNNFTGRPAYLEALHDLLRAVDVG